MAQVAMLIGGAAVAGIGALAPRFGATAQSPADTTAQSGGPRQEWLAPAITVGRNEMQIARFRAESSPQALLDDVTAHWARRAAPIQRSSEGGWLIAIQADGEWVETVRVQAHEGGAAGLRIRQRLAPGSSAPDRLAIERLLPQARIVNRTDQSGAGRAITSWVLVSQSAPGHLLAVARTEARRGGFSEDPAGTMSTANASGPLWLRRQGEELVVTTTPGLEGTVAVVHWSRKP